MIDFLLNNIVFVMIVLFGIFRLFSSTTKESNESEEEKTWQDTQAHRPEQAQKRNESGRSDLFGELTDLFQEIGDTTESTAERKVTQTEGKVVDTAKVARAETRQTATETHAEQMEQWRKRYAKPTEEKGTGDQLVGNLSGPVEVPGENATGVKDTDIRKHLTRRGLQESFVMAEILGSPRAFKPHQSSYRRRNI